MKKNRYTTKCNECNKDFDVQYYRRKTVKYCSQICKHIDQLNKSPWNKGKKNNGLKRIVSDITKEKMRLINIGKKHTEQTKEKLRIINLGKKSGKESVHWIIDRTKLRKSDREYKDGQYRDWMLAVKNRDGWKCKISNNECKGRLESHHILPWKDYPELRYQINNGITLCIKHHPRARREEIRLSPYFKKLLVN